MRAVTRKNAEVQSRDDDAARVVELTVVSLARKIGGSLGEEEGGGSGDELHGAVAAGGQ